MASQAVQVQQVLQVVEAQLHSVPVPIFGKRFRGILLFRPHQHPVAAVAVQVLLQGFVVVGDLPPAFGRIGHDKVLVVQVLVRLQQGACHKFVHALAEPLHEAGHDLVPADRVIIDVEPGPAVLRGPVDGFAVDDAAVLSLDDVGGRNQGVLVRRNKFLPKFDRCGYGNEELDAVGGEILQVFRREETPVPDKGEPPHAILGQFVQDIVQDGLVRHAALQLLVPQRKARLARRQQGEVYLWKMLPVTVVSVFGVWVRPSVSTDAGDVEQQVR